MTKKDIINLIEKDAWMMEILSIVKTLALPDWWIGAGFIRSKVWDSLHGYTKRTPLSDIDVIYLNRHDYTKEEAQKNTTKKEVYYEQLLMKLRPGISWSVTNQARMHLFHDDQPYQASEEALAQWVETATCIGARLDKDDNVVLATPKGIDDLVHLILRPTPGIYKNTSTFENRIKKKEWLKKWPKLKIIIN